MKNRYFAQVHFFIAFALLLNLSGCKITIEDALTTTTTSSTVSSSTSSTSSTVPSASTTSSTSTTSTTSTTLPPSQPPIVPSEPFTPASGNTYYVAASGNDSTGNGSMASPWASPGYASRQLHAGDTLIIRNG